MKRTILFLLILEKGLISTGQNFTGIGTTTPTYPFTVIAINNKGITQSSGSVDVGFYTTTAIAQLQTWTNHGLSFATNSLSEQMFINTVGNVGLGTSLPEKKLDIAGNIRMGAGTPVAGKLLETDANGLGEWKLRNSSGNRTIYVPYAAFVGSSSFMGHEPVNGVARYSPGYLEETYRYQAPILLPVGTIIKEITWFYFDNHVEKNLNLKLVRNNGGDENVVAITNSSGALNVDFSRNIVVNHTLGNYFYWLEISCLSWSSDESLRFKGAMVTYEE